MTIYNQDKTEIIENPDLELGRLDMAWRIFYVEPEIIHHEAVEAVEEQSHIEILHEYENGGKSGRIVIDVPGVQAQDAWDEVVREGYEDQEQVQVYIPYTEEELLENKLRPYNDEIYKLKQYLSDTDYCVIKSMEQGTNIQTAYPEEYQKRTEARNRINELEEQIEQVKATQ